MNPEYKRGWMATFKLLMLTFVSTLGWLWGRGLPGTMRFWVPTIIVITCLISEVIQKQRWNWKTFIYYVAIIPLAWGIMSTFCYGSNSWLRPLGTLLQRFIVGFTWSMPYILIAFRNDCKKVWILFGFHVLIVTLRMTVLGGLDILSAPEQEALTRGVLALIPPFIVRWKEDLPWLN